MNIKEQFTTVTSFSKILALLLFILLPIGGFWLGVEYTKSLNVNNITEKPLQHQQSSDTPRLVVGEDVIMQGKVVNNTSWCEEGCISDGPASLQIEGENFTYKVLYSYGEFPHCLNTKNFYVTELLKESEKVEVHGKLIEEFVISVCDSEKYYVERIEEIAVEIIDPNNRLDKEQMIKKAENTLINKWALDGHSEYIEEQKLEVRYFETSICIYDEDGQRIKTGSCWSVGYPDKTIKDEINRIQKDEFEILYYIAFDIKGKYDEDYSGGGCHLVGGDVLITNMGKVLSVEDTELCVEPSPF